MNDTARALMRIDGANANFKAREVAITLSIPLNDDQLEGLEFVTGLAGDSEQIQVSCFLPDLPPSADYGPNNSAVAEMWVKAARADYKTKRIPVSLACILTPETLKALEFVLMRAQTGALVEVNFLRLQAGFDL